MTVNKTFQLEVSSEELEMIQSALRKQSIKVLSRAQDGKRECVEKGTDDIISRLDFELHNKYKSLLDVIDNIQDEQ